MFSFANSIKKNRTDRKARRIEVRAKALKQKLLRKTTLLMEGRPLSEAYAIDLLTESVSLIPQCVHLLTMDELRLLESLKVEVEGVVGRTPCSGYCNVNSTDAHAGPCLHADGMVEVYGTAWLNCEPLISHIKLEIDRRSSSGALAS